MLERILDATRGRLTELRSRRGVVMERAEAAPPPPSFEKALTVPGLAVIAEIKRRSPSRGELAPGLDPVEQARRYAEGGAEALSVLTEPFFFSGDGDDLVAAREATGLPVLRKDFVLETVQVWEARALGASAVLLIVAAVSPRELSGLIEDAAQAGIDPLVEVHTPEEAGIALDVGARLIGVNNRDLTTFEVDLATAEEIGPLLSGASVAVAESGIYSRADAARMQAAGFDAVLVGEALIRSGDPARLLHDLKG
ncbi:MAG TPA: indole-3-glycerol phosphate synthase TrpC [Acidimicrobiia bacterium]|jgi:indole-3-glycerol phosphate synthase|nr:indole-3-glycerol phosphate synthase TrpC [Acidimicrobiia bacterium]